MVFMRTALMKFHPKYFGKMTLEILQSVSVESIAEISHNKHVADGLNDATAQRVPGRG